MITLKNRRIRFLVLVAATIFLVSLIIFLSNNKILIKWLHPLKYESQVKKYSSEFDLDPYLVFSIIKVESGYDQFAVSQKGAKGLMQVTDKTAVWAAKSLEINNFSLDNLFIPDINIRIGCWYLAKLKTEFGDNTILAITAYNGGSGRVKEWLNNNQLSTTGKTLEKIPFEETDKYIKKVIKEYKILKFTYSENKSK